MIYMKIQGNGIALVVMLMIGFIDALTQNCIVLHGFTAGMYRLVLGLEYMLALIAVNQRRKERKYILGRYSHTEFLAARCRYSKV